MLRELKHTLSIRVVTFFDAGKNYTGVPRTSITRVLLVRSGTIDDRAEILLVHTRTCTKNGSCLGIVLFSFDRLTHSSFLLHLRRHVVFVLAFSISAH